MTKILFITHSYPAFHSANSLCDEEIIKTRDDNTEIHVLCYRFKGQQKYEVIDGVYIHRIMKDYFWCVERNFRDPKYRNGVNKFFSRFIVRLRQVVYLPFFPNYDLIATRRLYRKAKKIVTVNSINKVICDFNGCDTLISGFKAATKTKVDFIPIFWDSLSAGFHSKYVSKKFNNKRKTKLEKKVINNSTLSIMMQPTKNTIVSYYENDRNLLDKIVFLDIPFYKSRTNEYIRNTDDNSPIKIVYGGATKERNIRPILEALRKTGLNIVFDFYTIDHTNKELRLLEKQYSFFIVHKAVSKADIECIYEKADFLVSFGVKNPNTISCKIFDYFSFCKPVISTYSIPNESCIPYIQKYPLGYLFNENLPNVEELSSFIKNSLSKRVDQKKVDNLFASNTAASYWHVFNK